MIRDVQKWEEWENEYHRHTPVDFQKNLAIMEGLYEHALAMGVWNKRAPLEGLESQIELARILNGRRTPEKTGNDA